MSQRSRVTKLERGWRCRCADGICTVGAFLTRFPDEPVPPLPELPSCPVCGGGTVVLVEELVVVGGDANEPAPAS
jgi:hypothetical protein